MDQIKTTIPNYVIDKRTKAVINTDEQAYSRLLTERHRQKHIGKLESDIKFLLSEVQTLRNEVNELRRLHGKTNS